MPRIRTTLANQSAPSALVPTAVKTANYTAVAGDLVPVDTTSGAKTVTLPSAPADKSQVAVKHVIQGGTNAVTIACGGSDVFNKAGGSTSLVLSQANQGMVLQYKASSGIWYVVVDSLSLAALQALNNATYAPSRTVADTLALRRLTNLAAADRQVSVANSRVSYEDAASIVETWANLTAWATAGTPGVQVSAGAVYGNGAGSGSNGATRAWPLGTTGVGRAIFVVNHVAAAGTGGMIVGVSSDTAGSAPTAGAANARGLYFHPSAVIQVADQGSFTNHSSGANPATGQYIVTVTADANYLSVVAVKSDGSVEYRARFTRGTFNIRCLYLFNSDSRQLTGDNIGPVGARQALVTVTPRTSIEGVTRTVHWSTMASGVSCRVALPPTYDSRKPAPLAICFHGNGSDETHFADNSNGLLVANALTSAGFIVASCGAGSTWGAQAALDAYYALYKFVRDNYAIGATVFYANSMGGIESLLALAERRIPEVSAWAATSPTASLASCYVDGSATAINESQALGAAEFTTTINTAYTITGAAPNDYATLTAGHDPLLKTGDVFRGLPMLFIAATDDYQVLKDKNTDPMAALVAAYSPSVTVTPVTGGHSFNMTSSAPTIASFLSGYAAA